MFHKALISSMTALTMLTPSSTIALPEYKEEELAERGSQAIQRAVEDYCYHRVNGFSKGYSVSLMLNNFVVYLSDVLNMPSSEVAKRISNDEELIDSSISTLHREINQICPRYSL